MRKETIHMPANQNACCTLNLMVFRDEGHSFVKTYLDFAS